MKRLTLISIIIFILTNIVYSQDIINETGKDGKFIVRDAEQQEALIIEDGNVGITGELKIESMPAGTNTDAMVVWDKDSKGLKIAPRVFSTVSPLSEPLETKSWHSLGYGEVGEDGNEISASVQGTAAAWNQFNTDFGYIKLGPANNWWAHIYTDVGKFLFNKPVYVKYGKFSAQAGYNLKLQIDGETRLFVNKDNGNVGIGTIDPSSILEIERDGGVGSTTIPILEINNSFNGTLSGTNQIMTALKFGSDDGSGAGPGTRAKIATVSPSTTGAKTDLAFYINDGSTSTLNKYMTIEGSTGNVGIGTASPDGALDITSTTGALIVPRMTTTQRGALASVNGSIIYNTSTNQFNFYESGSWVTK